MTRGRRASAESRLSSLLAVAAAGYRNGRVSRRIRLPASLVLAGRARWAGGWPGRRTAKLVLR